MREKVDKYLDQICSYVKYKPARQEIRDELSVHINELADEFQSGVQTEDEAVDMAIAAMGDCAEIGRRLNKQHRPETEWSIVALTAIIALLGGTVMFSTSQTVQMAEWSRFLFHAVIGVGVLAGLYFFDYTKLKRLAWPLYLLSMSVIFVLMLSGNRMGGRSYIQVFFADISFEYVMLPLLISYAGFIDGARGKGLPGLAKLCGLTALPLSSIALQPRMSLIITLYIGFIVLMLVAVSKGHLGGNKKSQQKLLGAVACFGVLLLVALIANRPYMVDRTVSFIGSFVEGPQDPRGRDYARVTADFWLQSSEMVGATSAKLDGRNIADTLHTLPATDYALISVFTTLGRIAGIALVLLIAAYIVRLFAVVVKVRNSFGYFLSLFACTVIAAQFLFSIFVNFGLFPSFSVYIPFISYGGVGYISNMALVGLVLSVWRRNKMVGAMQ